MSAANAEDRAITASPVTADEDLYKEINRMLILCFCEIFQSPEFQTEFDISALSRCGGFVIPPSRLLVGLPTDLQRRRILAQLR